MTDKKYDHAEIAELLAQGLSFREIGRRLNTDRMRVAQVAREIAVTKMPPSDVVPPGFHLASVNTEVNAAGQTARQWFNAKAGEEGDVVPEGGTFPAPDGMFVRSTSTLIDGQTGATKLQWVKSDKLKEQQANELLEAVRAAFVDSPRLEAAPAPAHCNLDLITCYPMGDPHLGLYSWAAETGADFDLQIAERNLIGAVERLVASAAASDTAFVVNVGDFYHSDNMQNRTMRSGNALDVDTRWSKVLRVGVRAMRAIIDCALRKHRHVTVVNSPGNHDDHSSQMLAVALAMFYERDPRVTFLDSPGKFHYLRFGQCLFGVTHGDTVKPDKLPLIMARDRPEDWGCTKFRYWHTGHIHTRRVFEEGEVLVESFRTLAAPDAWTTGSGYRSGRDMYAITYHKDLGEIERHRVDVAALEVKP